jgi:hypothetical protein
LRTHKTPGGFRYLQFDSLSEVPNLRHLFSLSSKNGSGNISLSGDRNRAAALLARKEFLSVLHADPSSLVVGGQVHGAGIHSVRSSDQGRGAFEPISVLPRSDGLLTTAPNIPLMTSVGDCGAVLLFVSKPKPGLAVLHAGWRGLVAGILSKGVRLLCSETGAQPQNILAGIGPSIGPKSFQVHEDVAQYAPESCSSPHKDRFLVDLPAWAGHQLVESGLSSINIETIAVDTFTEDSFCFSHRRQGSAAGRMGLFAVLSGCD